LQRIARGGPVYYQFDRWVDNKAISHGVFTRLGGVSCAPWASLNVGGTVGDDSEAVQRNLQAIFDTLELERARACTVWQIHSADAVVVTHRVDGRAWLARADGMTTNIPGLPLTMRFADCTPLLMYDPVQRAIGLAHAGWRGTVGQVGLNTLRAMQAAYGTNPEDVEVAIGPSIGPEHYQVGPEVVEAIQRAFGTAEGLIRRARDGSAYLDLWAANRLSLERAGVHKFEVAGMCTAKNVEEFFSHRAERGKTGRFCAVIALNEAC
jgi:YfiH family protein